MARVALPVRRRSIAAHRGRNQPWWLAAAFVAIKRPETFGNVLSQSGSFWATGPGDAEYEGVARAIASSPKLPIRFNLEVGLLEGMQKGAVAFADNRPDMVVANRHLRTLLQAKGYDFHYREFPGAHDFGYWSITFPDRLVELIASRDQQLTLTSRSSSAVEI